MKLNSRVIELNENQPEFSRAIWDYMDQMVSDERVTQGTVALKTYADLLRRIEQRYGVDRYIVLAVRLKKFCEAHLVR